MHLQKSLLEVEIKRQRSGKIKRKSGLVGRGKILHGARQGKNLAMKLNRACSLCRNGHAGDFAQEQYFSPQKRSFVIQFQHFEALPAFGDQVEAAVGIFLRNGDDLGRASNTGKTFIESSDDSKGRIVGAGFTDHLFIAWLENVQRKKNAGKEHNVERKERKKRHKSPGVNRSCRCFDCTTENVRAGDAA